MAKRSLLSGQPSYFGMKFRLQPIPGKVDYGQQVRLKLTIRFMK